MKPTIRNRTRGRYEHVLVTAAVLLIPLQLVIAHETHPIAMHELDWSAEQIKRVNSMAMDFQSGELVIIWTLPGRVETVAGRSCLVGPYFIFDVDDEFAFDIDETVTVELLFDRTETEGFIISYDHAVDTPVSKTIVFDAADQTRWHSETITLKRAGFANRRHGHTDLGVAALGAVLAYDAGADHELVLCDIKIERTARSPSGSRPTGTLSLTIRDPATGAPTAARVGFYDAAGRLPRPGDEALTVRRFNDYVKELPLRRGFEFWPVEGRYAFYVSGDYEAQVPADSYELVVSKGPEYRIHRQRFEVGADNETKVDVALERWIDMPAKGWYSGDNHIHIERPREANPSISAQLRAEDIHISNLLQASNPARYYFSQYAFGHEGQYADGEHVLVPGQESPRTAHRGHTISLNGRRYYDPKNYFLYHETAAELQADGGLFGYAHVNLDAFHASWGLALDVPMGLVNFVEVLQFHQLGTEILYDFWNLGFKVVPAAGSDYPYVDLPGTERSYVYIEGDFSPQSWFEGLKSGRTFVTTAPMLKLSAAGRSIGETVNVASGNAVTIEAAADINPDFDTLVRLELVLHGDVVATARSENGSENLSLAYELTARESCWVAVRAYGKDGTVAHSAPIYVIVDGMQDFWKRSAVPQLVEKYKAKIEALTHSVPEIYQDLEKWETAELVGPAWQAQRPALRERAEIVLKRYDDLLKRASHDE